MYDDMISLPEGFVRDTVSGYHVIYGKEITQQNIRDALDIDYMCYDDIYHLDWEQCAGYHRKNPYIYIMAVDDEGSVVGYINFSPVTGKIYDLMRSGKSVDTIICAEDILEYEEGKDYSVYFSSICVHPDHRGKGIAGMLLNTLIELLRSIDAAGINIERIVADAVTDSGERLLTSLGFEVVCMSEHGSKIMERKHNG